MGVGAIEAHENNPNERAIIAPFKNLIISLLTK